MIDVAIVGGGPAGSHCAYHIAESSMHPVIFDNSHPREKPCGGLLSPFALQMFPFLDETPVEHIERNRIDIVSPYGRRVRLNVKKGKFLCFSRSKLDEFLVDRAVGSGAELIREKVLALRRAGHFWEVETSRSLHTAKVIVGADGVNSLVRRSTVGPLSLADRGFCYGYLVKGLEKEELTLIFLPEKKGYVWIFPRNNHTSLGIGCSETSRSREIRKELDIFVERHYPNVRKISRWAALIPHIKSVRAFNVPMAGPNWILIGDAAGHVNPVIGEGLPYAFLDGELAAQAIVVKEPHLFEKLWREAYGSHLFRAIRLMRWIHKKTLLEMYCRFLKFQTLL